MHIGNSVRRGATIAVSAVGIAAASVALAVPASASSLDTNAALGQMNAARAKLGCGSLSVNAQLTDAAQGQSAYMAKVKNATATGANKSTPQSRIADAGYDASSSAELQLATPVTASTTDAVGAMLASKTVRSTIANCTFTQVGIGLQAGPNNQSYWAVSLARPA